MSSKAENDDDTKEEVEEKQIMYQQTKRRHKSTGQPSHNQGPKNTKNKKYKNNYSQQYIHKLYRTTNTQKNSPRWSQEIAEILSNATFNQRQNGTYQACGKNKFNIIYI